MIRYKPLPPSRSLDDTREIHRAVPLDPTATDDCCARLARSVPLSDPATAREWLGFFEALELVGSDADGYYRLDWPADEIHERGRGGPDPDTRIRRLLGWSRQFGLVTESNGEYGMVGAGDSC